jgi:hypothetical protein
MNPDDELMKLEVERMFDEEANRLFPVAPVNEAGLDEMRCQTAWLDAKEVLGEAIKVGDQKQIEMAQHQLAETERRLEEGWKRRPKKHGGQGSRRS